MIFSKDYQDVLKKLNYNKEKFQKTVIFFTLLFSTLVTLLILAILLFNKKPIFYAIYPFVVCLVFFFTMIRSLPLLALKKKRAELESDLLYSARHLLIKLESGSSLVNSLESVSELKTSSSLYFRELMMDISLGMPVEDAINKAVEYSPSKAYTKMLEEISTSLKTGSFLQKTLRTTLDDITRNHLINIQEYGKKLNPMSMFYMILGTIIPSLGTAMLIVASSLLPGVLIIDIRILMFIAGMTFVIQLFFLLAFRSLKPMVME
jgi:pilus assembly protein TadC